MRFERGKPAAPARPAKPAAPPAPPRPAAPAPAPRSEPPTDPAIRENLSRTHLSLKAIREELEQFEHEIAVRDERLLILEKEAKQAKSLLEQERTRSRQADAAGLTARLQEARRQIEEQAQALLERDDRLKALAEREQALSGQVQLLSQERARGAQALAQMARQIQQQQERTRALEQQLVTNAGRGAGAPADATVATGGLGGRWSALSTRARVSIGFGVATMVLASVALAGGVLLRDETKWRATGMVLLPKEQVDLAQKRLAQEGSVVDLKIEASALDARTACLRLALADATASAARDTVDKVGRAMAAGLMVDAPALANAEERRELEAQLQQLDQQLAVLSSQPAGVASLEPAALSEWREKLAERRELDQKLKALAPVLSSTAPEPGQFVAEAKNVAATQAGDSKLQADVGELRRREQQLRDQLVRALDAGEIALNRMAADIVAATKDVTESSQDSADSDVSGAMAGITTALSEWTRAVSEVRDAWRTAQRGLADPRGDILRVQRAIEPAVQTFIEQTRSAKAALEKSLEVIAQGGEEPTKRIVLRNTLSRQLQPALTAQEAASQSLRSLLSGEDPDVGALVQGIAGLRQQVADARDRIATTMQAQAYQRAQHEYEQNLSAARGQQAQWLKRAAELDEVLLEQNRKVLDNWPAMETERTAAQQRAELYRARSQVLARLAAFSRKDADALLSRAEQIRPLYIPAFVAAVPGSDRPRVAQAMVLGSLPLISGGLIAASIWAGALYSRSRRLARDYERLLREAQG